jgi:high-affinity iron transporter
MARSLFSIPIFFIVFRETLEAVIIISVLLGLVEQIVRTYSNLQTGQTTFPSSLNENDKKGEVNTPSRVISADVDDDLHKKRILRKMRFQACSALRVRYIACR